MALAQIVPRRGSSAAWLASNPVLAEGESGYDTTARRLKIGDGVTVWSALGWAMTDPATIARLEALADLVESGAPIGGGGSGGGAGPIHVVRWDGNQWVGVTPPEGTLIRLFEPGAATNATRYTGPTIPGVTDYFSEPVGGAA